MSLYVGSTWTSASSATLGSDASVLDVLETGSKCASAAGQAQRLVVQLASESEGQL
jgi:hypothetical protein